MFYSTLGKDDVICPHMDCFVVKTSADTRCQLSVILPSCTRLYLPDTVGHIPAGIQAVTLKTFKCVPNLKSAKSTTDAWHCLNEQY